VFIIIEDLVHPPYLIDNQLRDIFCTVNQKGYSRGEEVVEVAPEETTPFCWANYQEEHEL
jgi:hypothetical protein